jgi:peptidoglycan biosynthesis protein MviN/MurJ (putative lipid II flippase)
MLAMAVVTSAVMFDGLRVSRTRGEGLRIVGGVRRAVRCVWMVLSSTAVYLAFNCLYVITLAFASKYGAGGATVLSYAYLFASYLVAATGFALGMSRIADMTRSATTSGRELIASTVPGGFRYSMLLVAPALGALIAGGATLIGEVLPASFDPSQVTQLRVFTALLCAWTVAALLVNLLLPALFALGRTRLVNGLAPVVVLLHAAVTALGGILFGVNGVVGAFCVVPAAFAAVLLLAGAGRGWPAISRELIRDGLRFAACAALAFGIGVFVATSFFHGLVAPLVAMAVGLGLYGLTSTQLAPRQIRLLVGAVRPSSAEAPAGEAA